MNCQFIKKIISFGKQKYRFSVRKQAIKKININFFQLDDKVCINIYITGQIVSWKSYDRL